MPEPLDEHDREILAGRVLNRDAKTGPRVGDWVQFADRERPARRIAFLWDTGAQTTDGGSFYLGPTGDVNFSGGLCPSVPFETPTHTDQMLEGSVWFFHHDYPTAGGGVTVSTPCRVYLCCLPTNH